MAIQANQRASEPASARVLRRSGWRGRAGVLLAWVGVLLGVATSAHAGDLDADVAQPVPTSVSLSVPGSTPAVTYNVTLTNNGTNTINNSRFVAQSVVNGGGDAKATFRSVSGIPTSSCTVSADKTSIDCAAGTLAPGVTNQKKFTVTFNSPSAGTFLDLVWQAVFDLGTPPGNSNGDNGTLNIELVPIKNNEVTSAIPVNEELNVFTGNLALPSSTDQFTVAVKVPPVPAEYATTASVVETDISQDTTCKAQGNFKKCFKSSISVVDGVDLRTIDDTNNKFLTFLLRVDKSNLRGGAKIDKVVIRYEVDKIVVEEWVNYCERPDGIAVPDSNGTPCIAKAEDFSRKKSLDGWFGFQWTIITYKNGTFDLF